MDELYQLTDLVNNHNKQWRVVTEELPDGKLSVTTYFSRTGYADQSSTRTMTEKRLQGLIRQKERKGYRKVVRAADNGVSTPAILSAHKSVDELWRMIFAEAGEYIDSYLDTSIDTLAPEQIETGRRTLQFLASLYAANDPDLRDTLITTAQEYYNLIPTQLPRQIDPWQVTRELCENLHEQEERLDQLETAIATSAGVQLDAEIVPVEGDEFKMVRNWVQESLAHDRFRRARIHNIFRVNVPTDGFDDLGNCMMLFHGTRNPNMRHILRTGLKLPQHKAHGWMFGAGIYFADISSKSMQYCQASHRHPNILLVARVSLGKIYTMLEADSNLRSAPAGHHSVLGKANHTRSWHGRLAYNEYIVYRAKQQQIKYLVTWR